MRLYLRLLTAGVLGLTAFAPYDAIADRYCRGWDNGHGCVGYVLPDVHAPVRAYHLPAVVYSSVPAIAPVYVYPTVPLYGAAVTVSLLGVSMGINIPLH